MYLGVDLGATHLRTAVADADTIIATHTTDTPVDDGAAVSTAIGNAVETVCASAGITPREITGVGVGTLGPLDDTGVTDPPNLPGVDYIPIEDPLHRLTEAPVTHRNDAITGLVAERQAGAPPDCVYLTISSGIGAGVCVDGHVLTGANGNGAEVGHLVVAPDDGLACGCGGTGHWEAYCSGTGIPRHATHLDATERLETTLPLTAQDLDAPTVLAAPDGDPLADRLREQIVRYNTLGLAAITHAYDPEQIIIGGAVATNNHATLIDPAVEELPSHLVTTAAPEVTLTTHDEPVLTGAIALARDTPTA